MDSYVSYAARKKSSLNHLPHHYGCFHRMLRRKSKHNHQILWRYFWWIVIGQLRWCYSRSLPASLAMTFLDPTLGPVIRGFVSKSFGWRWVQEICCIFIALGIFDAMNYFDSMRTTSSLRRMEPSCYITILYGTVYLFMGVVYNQDCGWSEGIGDLEFMVIVVAYR